MFGEKQVLECPSCGHRSFEEGFISLGVVAEVHELTEDGDWVELYEANEGENSLVVEWERSEDR